MTMFSVEKAGRFGLGRRGGRAWPKLLTPTGWFAMLALTAIATGAAAGFLR